MWDIYNTIFFRQFDGAVPDDNVISGYFLEEPGDTIEYDLTKQELSLGSWDNVSKNLKMPYEGTNRFDGLMYTYKDGGLTKAWHREYVYR